jgi:hypothetical protein
LSAKWDIDAFADYQFTEKNSHQLNDFTPSNLTGLESRNNSNRNQSLLVSGLNFNLNKGINSIIKG